jgi:hypothetical protein
MTESKPPRVRVTLPGGRVVEGRLLGWRQGADGEWVPQVAIEVPAAAVARVDGEDYSHDPRTAAGPRYVVVTRHGPVGGKAELVLHKAGCWVIDRKHAIRVTPVEDAAMARTALRFEDTVACDVCKPEA